jgi:hypothetical protein
MKVVVTDEQELFELAKELLHVLANLRYWSDQWNKYHGSVLLNRKKFYEQKADTLLERLKTKGSVHRYDVHIKIENDADKG